MKIGFAELIIIFIVALVVIGPDKLPAFAKKLGEALSQIRKASSDAAEDIKKSVAEPLSEIQKPLQEAAAPFAEAERDIQSHVKDVQNTIRDIGKMPRSDAGGTSLKEEDGAYENRNDGTDPDPGSRADHLRADTDPEADENVRQGSQEL